jgi:cell division inhibitor SepF
MAGAIRRMATYLGLVEDDQYYTDQDSHEPVDRDRVAVTQHSDEPHGDRDRGSVHQMTRPWDRPGYHIPSVLPTTYNDARRIGEEFRSDAPVIMDLTSMSDAEAKRIVDFAAGLVFGLRGTIERLTPKVFLLSPDGVDVSDLAHDQVSGAHVAR